MPDIRLRQTDVKHEFTVLPAFNAQLIDSSLKQEVEIDRLISVFGSPRRVHARITYANPLPFMVNFDDLDVINYFAMAFAYLPVYYDFFI